jgi:4a-hydroxytetrahydrobiopterin dehydratase
MARPQKLTPADVSTWLSAHGGWSEDGNGLAREFKFKDFSAALGFVVRVGLAAEKADHHPDIAFGWGKARVFWSTHDAGGITRLDLDLAEASDAIFAG